MSQDNHANLSRRTLLKGMAAAAGTSMLPAMLSASRAHAGNGKPETTKAKLGFIALTDAAPLFVALEKGLFAKHGMPDVEVLKQSSWGTTRDNLVLGSARGGIDGGHILTPMPYLMTAGINSEPVAMSILARLNLNGQCISVGNEYKDLNVGVDTFCVCDPWNHQLINQGIGYTANTTGELWNDHPEKAFALRSDYVAASHYTRCLAPTGLPASLNRAGFI